MIRVVKNYVLPPDAPETIDLEEFDIAEITKQAVLKDYIEKLENAASQMQCPNDCQDCYMIIEGDSLENITATIKSDCPDSQELDQFFQEQLERYL